MKRRRKPVALGIRSMHADVGDHIAYFWETEQEFGEAVAFLEEGIPADDHLVIFGHDEANARVRDILDARGHRCALLEQQGRLSILGPESTGEFMLARIGTTFQAAIDGGASMIRLLGNIGWGRKAWPDQADILRFEAKVTAAAAAFPCVVLCMYDIGSLSGSILLDGAFGTHPLTIYRNLIRKNPLCVDVEAFLAGLDESRS